MGEWASYDGDPGHGQGVYVDGAGVQWHVWGANATGFGGGWSAQPLEFPNKYNLPNDVTAYSDEDTRDGIIARIDDAAYVWRQTDPDGDLYATAQAARDAVKGGDNKFGAGIFVLVLLWLASKGKRR